MNKIYLYLLIILTTLSCSYENEVTLDNNATERVDDVIKSYYETLTSYKHGWIAEVETSKGVYQFYMDFSADNTVTMYTDNLMYPSYNGIAKKSTYNIRSLQLPTLSFDTYSYLSILNDPNNAVSGGQYNQGLKTDFEFEIINYINGKFELKGRINRVYATLHKASAYEASAVTESEMQNSINNVLNYNYGEYSYFTTASGIDVSLVFAERTIELNYIKKGGEVSVNYKYTLPRMDYSVDIVGEIFIEDQEFKGLKWENNKFYAQIGNQKYEVKSQTNEIIPLHKLMGTNNRYVEIYSMPEMFPNESNKFRNLVNELVAQTGIQEMFVNFDKENKMLLTIFLPTNYGNLEVVYTYDIKYNDDKSSFTVLNVDFSNDVTGYADNLYHVLEDIVGADKSILHYWLNKEFTIEWTDEIFDDYKMRLGAISELNSTNKFYGIPF